MEGGRTRRPAVLRACVVVLPTNPEDEEAEGCVHCNARAGGSGLGIVGDSRKQKRGEGQCKHYDYGFFFMKDEERERNLVVRK